MTTVYRSALLGLLDSVSFHRCLVLMVRSKKIRFGVLKCLILNGVIFLGSISFFSLIINPLWSRTLAFAVGNNSVVEAVRYWTELVYYVFWIFPVYLLSFVLNAFWYQDIASDSIRVYPLKRPTPVSSSTLTGDIAEAIHRAIFNICFLMYLVLVQRWRLIYLVNLSWLIAFNAFEYKWINEKMTFETKLQIVESNWIYFIAFGFPLAVISFQFPSIIENGLISVAFPFLLMMAASTPNPMPQRSGGGRRIRILFIPELMTKIFIILIKFFSK